MEKLLLRPPPLQAVKRTSASDSRNIAEAQFQTGPDRPASWPRVFFRRALGIHEKLSAKDTQP
jgi:hypothetical protein